jgi:F-type H+-transporting ATPase subunit gamma
MATLRDIKKRIGSVKSTHKITKAMKMVAAARLRTAEERMRAGRPYSKTLDAVITNLYRRTESEGFPLLEGKEEVKTVEILVITSDRGLCGGFNGNVLRFALRTKAEFEAEGKQVKISFIGRKAQEYLRHREIATERAYLNILGDHNFALAKRVGDELISDFMEDRADEVYLVFNEFASAMTQNIVNRRLAPVVLQGLDRPEGMESVVDYRYEPDKDHLLADLLPLQIHYQLYHAFLESFASEMGARMSAMESATKNAEEMVEKLTLRYNRARQAAITTELTEIINGANAIS